MSLRFPLYELVRMFIMRKHRLYNKARTKIARIGHMKYSAI